MSQRCGTSSAASARTFPDSSCMTSVSSSPLASSQSRRRSSHIARPSKPSASQAGWAVRTRATTSATRSGPSIPTSRIVEPSAGRITANVSGGFPLVVCAASAPVSVAVGSIAFSFGRPGADSTPRRSQDR